MIFPPDCLLAVELFDEAHESGARFRLAVNELGLVLRSYHRFKG